MYCVRIYAGRPSSRSLYSQPVSKTVTSSLSSFPSPTHSGGRASVLSSSAFSRRTTVVDDIAEASKERQDPYHLSLMRNWREISDNLFNLVF